MSAKTNTETTKKKRTRKPAVVKENLTTEQKVKLPEAFNFESDLHHANSLSGSEKYKFWIGRLEDATAAKAPRAYGDRAYNEMVKAKV